MSILMQNIRNKASKIATTRWLPEFPERLKGGRIEKWKNYWGGVKRDYIEATEDVIKSSKESPFKTTIILGISGFLGYCVKSNPTLEDYKLNYLDNSLDILQVNETIRNKKSENLQNYISRAMNANLIRRNNYGLFSIIWVDDFAPELAVFAARCEYIKPTTSDLRARLIDVGFLGRWWISSRKMLEFDVNDDEWDSVTGMPVQPSGQLKQMCFRMVTVQSTVDTGHEDMIHDAQMDFYGTRLATCSSDRIVKIFDVKDGTQTLAAELRSHEGPVWQVAWAHPRFGNILASCSYDRRVIIWQESSGQWSRIYEYTNHDSSVNSVAWAPHELGLILVCGSSDGAISVLTYAHANNSWEAEKINNAHTIGCNSVSWSQASNQKRFVSGGCDSLVKIWRQGEDGHWNEEAKLESHSDWVRDTAWAPSLGPSKQVIASCSQDRRVIIWTCKEGGAWIPKVLHTFEDVVWHVSWSVCGNILAVSGGDNKVSLWKETLNEEWVCISDVQKGAGAQG